MHKINNKVEVPTTERFIDIVLSRVKRCEKHPEGVDGHPCYHLTGDKPSEHRFGVCDWRARQAGFVGVPSPTPEAKTNPVSVEPRVGG